MTISDDGYKKVAQSWLHNPHLIRSLRKTWKNREGRVDVWGIESSGLISEREAQLLAWVSYGGQFNDPVKPPTYVAYQSLCIAPNEQGGECFDRVFERVRFEPLVSAVARTPLSSICLMTALCVRDALSSDTRMAEGLAALARIAPKKGGEIDRLIRAYLARFPELNHRDVPAMICRDFFSSTYVWQFIRCPDALVHDLCGSLLCVTTAVDYVGSPDDAGAQADAYKVASGDGLTLLEGPFLEQIMTEVVVACVFMKVKDQWAAVSSGVKNLNAFIAASGGRVTPEEFIVARWWDTGMGAYHRLIMNSPGYAHLMGGTGTFTAMSRCARIRRAVDNLIRYSEVIDFVADTMNSEFFNELFIALAAGGSAAVQGYGCALGAVTDDVLTCDCIESGHDEAAELSMGACLWYLLLPRYQGWRQLQMFSRGEGEVSAAFAPASVGHRLERTRVSLTAGNLLHSSLWQPLWVCNNPPEDGAAREEMVVDMARRIVRRCLVKGVYDCASLRSSESIVQVLLQHCDVQESLPELCALSAGWINVFEQCLALNDMDCVAHQAIVCSLEELIARIWECVVVAGEQAADDAEALFYDCDTLIRQTYALPFTEGFAIRRAFFGVTSSALEFSGFNPYARLSDGVARVCSQRV